MAGPDESDLFVRPLSQRKPALLPLAGEKGEFAPMASGQSTFDAAPAIGGKFLDAAAAGEIFRPHAEMSYFMLQ